jgi:hypothetical protein
VRDKGGRHVCLVQTKVQSTTSGVAGDKGSGSVARRSTTRVVNVEEDRICWCLLLLRCGAVQATR